LVSVTSAHKDQVQIELAPVADGGGEFLCGQPGHEQALGLRQSIGLGANLTMSLTTHNHGQKTVQLTQALHSYFAVSDAQTLELQGLGACRYLDKLRDMAEFLQAENEPPRPPIDRIYASAHSSVVLHDKGWRRRVHVASSGSHSVVVWNPGPDLAQRMGDIGREQCNAFYCVEVANAGFDVVALAPGAQHTLTQALRVEDLSD
jgi:glucose-6-phosphate 1-epimerase